MTTETPARPGHIDKEALRRRYAEERDKRLRPDGNDQYLRLTGELARYQDDPHTPWTERAPRIAHRTVVCVGGGFAGLVVGARLREAGVDVRIVEKGGGFGGTWYWNRYPGAQCDTASMVYLPLLEETGHMPTEKYVHGPEILAHCQRVARRFGLHEDVLFHTEVTGLTWDEARGRWIVETSRGDRMTAQFVVLGTPYARRAGFEVTGRGGGTLSEHWAGGMRTLHGIHVRGFPNLLFVQPTQGANLISNIPHNIADSARTIAVTVRHALDHGFGAVEPSQEAEDAWVELLLSGPGSMIGGPDCTPGYYNNEGQDPGSFLGRGYPYGPSAYFAYIDEWRASGAFDGLEFR